MNRKEFLNKVVRFLLFGLLALTAAITGSRTATGNDCSSCPGKGICKGESDCSTFYLKKNGRTEK
jgi:hypothetical protein